MFRAKANFEWLTVLVCLLSNRNSHCKNQIEKNERPLKPYASLCSMGFHVCCVFVCVFVRRRTHTPFQFTSFESPLDWAASLRLYRITTTDIRLVCPPPLTAVCGKHVFFTTCCQLSSQSWSQSRHYAIHTFNLK